MVFPDFHFKAGVTIPVPFYLLKTVACAQLFLALLKRKEAEYWKALCLHHCVSSTYLLDLFPLSCNLAFALSLRSHCLVHAWCIVYAHTHWIQGWNNHRAQSIRMFIWRFQVCVGDFLLLWVRHLYWQHFIFKETVIKIKRLNKLKKIITLVSTPQNVACGHQLSPESTLVVCLYYCCPYFILSVPLVLPAFILSSLIPFYFQLKKDFFQWSFLEEEASQECEVLPPESASSESLRLYGPLLFNFVF